MHRAKSPPRGAVGGARLHSVAESRETFSERSYCSVAAGGSLLDPSATTAVLERMRRAAEPAGPLAKLSEQERTVLELIGEGLTNRQIGERMFLAEKTVKNYVSHLLAKLGLERRTQAAVLATELRGSGFEPRHDGGATGR